MEDKIMEIIYDKIKDINFYNYDNDEKLKNIDIKLYENILGKKVIDVILKHETFTINCVCSYADKESVN